MYTPTTFAASVGLMFLSMLCWGSWANSLSLCRGKYRFELFYWDYAIGVLLGALALAMLLGPDSALFHGPLAWSNVGWALLSGVVFSLGNILLVAAISVSGMAVAFPVCIGLALLIGVGLSWCIEPVVPLVPMAVGSALVLVSMIFDAAAYRTISRTTVSSTRGIMIAVLGGIFMGAFPPCLQKGLIGTTRLDPYAAVVVLAAGIMVCTFATNYVFMRHPIAGGPPVALAQYFGAPLQYHALGILGGAVWAAGTVFNTIAGAEHKVGVAISYAFGTGGTLVAVVWGVLVWNEFRGAPRRSYFYLLGMFAAFLAGIAVIAWAKSTMPLS